MKIIWSPRAIEHLISVRTYIAQENPAAAERVAARIAAGVEQLSHHPHLGRPGRVPGTREIVLAGTPYVLPYRVRKGSVEIIAVFHGRQRWPELL